MKKNLYLALAFSAAVLSSCQSNKVTENEENTLPRDSVPVNADSLANREEDKTIGRFIEEKGGIKLHIFNGSPDFPTAKLAMKQPDTKKVLPEGKIHFDFEVKNFELTKQTEDAPEKHCANSAQGQHIHHILNNSPYVAYYNPSFDTTLPAGHYVDLAFLSRSYHESIKHKSAYVLTQFDVAKKGKAVDLNGSHLFYSRPKGEYKGADTKKVLLDFYLVNTELATDGNKVRLTVNGNEFMLTSWTSYALLGLPMGKNIIKLELMDKEGNLIPGPFNSVEREITLSE